MNKDILEELLQTIEANAIDNKATITNVSLWADSWRKEQSLLNPSSTQVKEKYTKKFDGWYKNYLSRPNEGLADLYGNKITDKDYLFKRWNEDLDTLIV